MNTINPQPSEGYPLVSDPLAEAPICRPIDIRESMRRDLPEWMQLLLTLVTAKPYKGQKPFQRTPLNHLMTALLACVLGAVFAAWIIAQGSGFLILLPLGWCLILHGLRKLRLTLEHACSHSMVFGAPCDRWLGEAISILTVTRSFQAYKQAHTEDHHSGLLLQPGDETYNHLINTVGFRPGMSVEQLWQHLWKTLFSPEFHLRVWRKRLKACFLSPFPLHNVLACTTWGFILSLIAYTQTGWLCLLVWGLPLTVLFQMSALLRQCVEHRWPDPSAGSQRNARILGSMTSAIFLGEHTPFLDPSASNWNRCRAWTFWTLRMLGYHLPARALVLTGDTPCHDYHHRHPGSKEWCNAIFARQHDLEAGCPGWPVSYQETWGLLEAMNETFKSLSRQASLRSDGSPTNYLLEDYRRQKDVLDECLTATPPYPEKSLGATLREVFADSA